jgi:hypothetical protein
MKETISIRKNCTFAGQVYPTGFFENRPSTGLDGGITGTWKIIGKFISMNIVMEKNGKLENKVSLSTIISFKEDELTLKSDGDVISLLQRIKPL